MNKLILSSLTILFLFSYSIYITFFNLTPSSTNLQRNENSRYHEYRGVTHAHTNQSSGSESPGKVIQSAKDAQLNFLILTDENPKENESNHEGYHGPLLAIQAGEYSYLDSHLLMYHQSNEAPPERLGQAQIYFHNILSTQSESIEEGFLVLAHPFLSNFGWGGEYPEGLRGIEILNLKRVLEYSWRLSKTDVGYAFLSYPLNPKLALLFLLKTPKEELRLWDELSLKRKTTGFFGTDATAKAILWEGLQFKFPTYQTLFEVGSNHILLNSELTGHVQTDKKKILQALFQGNFFFAVDILGDATGFVSELKIKRKFLNMGSEVKFEQGIQIVTKLPSSPAVPFEIVVIKNGVPAHVSNQIESSYDVTTPGVYRVEVRIIPQFPLPFGKRWLPWIYTNNFYVR